MPGSTVQRRCLDDTERRVDQPQRYDAVYVLDHCEGAPEMPGHPRNGIFDTLARVLVEVFFGVLGIAAYTRSQRRRQPIERWARDSWLIPAPASKLSTLKASSANTSTTLSAE